ncbi:MAG: mechanosensitive ion channel domain-containing protein, partial [Bacteroidota bacterium]
MNRYFKKNQVDAGRKFAFTQFTKYIIYTVAILMALEALGIKLSVLWGGAAALLVGIGLGLQQTFNDLVSGLILLIEGSVEVGDIIQVDGLIGKVESINIRTSQIGTRDNVSILVPNSKLVGENAINWSHTPTPARFQIRVGVSYNSDVDLVTSLLLKAAETHPKVLKTPTPTVQFIDFGSSSLDFDI